MEENLNSFLLGFPLPQVSSRSILVNISLRFSPPSVVLRLSGSCPNSRNEFILKTGHGGLPRMHLHRQRLGLRQPHRRPLFSDRFRKLRRRSNATGHSHDFGRTNRGTRTCADSAQRSTRIDTTSPGRAYAQIKHLRHGSSTCDKCRKRSAFTLSPTTRFHRQGARFQTQTQRAH
jgi:hypothetical protein